MYNKGLNCKFKHAGRQGRSKHRIGFPRHIINRYEGTHLPMKKTYSGWDDWHGPWINYNHVIGLINRFVNKPYNKFLKVWHAKLKLTSEYIRQTYSLRRIIDMEKVKHRVYSIEFYVDKDGIIRRYEQTSRPRYRSQLTKYQRKYNDNVKIPYLGVCKYDVSPYNLYRHGKTNPILLGEFYVALEGNVVKVPVYTCCSQLMIGYHNAKKLSEYIRDRDFKQEEKKRRITEDWLSIKATNYWNSNPISLNLEQQYVFKEIPNPGRISLINQLSIAISKGNTEEANRLRDLIAKTPKTKTIDVGYGKFYLFVKRADYEKQLKILHET